MVDVRALALFAWVSAFVHLLTVISGASEISLRSFFLLLTAVASAVPTIVGASALLFAAGDQNAALQVLLGRVSQAPPHPAAITNTKASVVASGSVAAGNDNDGDDHNDDDASDKGNRGCGPSTTTRRTQSGDAGLSTIDGEARDPDSPIPPSLLSPPAIAADADADADATTSKTSPIPPQGTNLTLNETSSDQEDNDDDEGNEEGWQEAITGIKGMAHALAEANNSVSVVALNSDLTVSLSTLMLKTINLFDPTGRGSDTNAGGEDARVMHLADAHKIVGDTCMMAEPLFDTGCPLVLYNRLTPGDLCFLPRDTFSCCLFALVYRAGTRILRGNCVMTAEMIKEPNPKCKSGEASGRAAAKDGRESGHGTDGARKIALPTKFASSSTVCRRAAVGVDDDDANDADPSIFDTAEDIPRVGRRTQSVSDIRADARDAGDKEEVRCVRVTVEYEAATTVRNLKHVKATELRLWKRRLKGIGGSLKSETVTGGFATQTERIVISVPTAGSETFLLQHPTAGARKDAKKAAQRRSSEVGARSGSRRGSLKSAASLERENGERGDGPRSRAGSDPANGDDDDNDDDDDDDDDIRGGGDGGGGGTQETSELEKSGGRRGTMQNPCESLEDGDGGSPKTNADTQTFDSDSMFDTIEDSRKLLFKILYIEDERVQAYFFINKCKRVFGDECTVVHETDGVAALERLQKGEQYNIIVSDIFMAGMDGVSFFRTLFSTNLNTDKLHVEGVDESDMRMNLILTGADIMPVFCEDEELSAELASLTANFGVLVYNKTSAVDVISDVIKPHITFVTAHVNAHVPKPETLPEKTWLQEPSRLTDWSEDSNRSNSGSIQSAGETFVTTATERRSALLAANQRSETSFGGRSNSSVSHAGDQRREPSFVRGTGDRWSPWAAADRTAGGPSNHGEKQLTGYETHPVRRSEVSLGKPGSPFPDTSSIRENKSHEYSSGGR